MWATWFFCLLIGTILLFSDLKNDLEWISPLRWYGIAFLILHVIMPFNILYFRNILDIKFEPLDYILMSLASVIAGTSFWIGWQLKWQASEQKKNLPLKNISLNSQQLLQLLILLPISIAALVILARAYGGLLFFAIVPIDAIELIRKEYFNIFSLIFAAFVPLTILTLYQFQKARRFGKVWWAFAGVVFFLTYFFISLKLGSRYRLLFILFPVFALYLSTRPNYLMLKTLIFSGCFSAIFFILGRIRYKLVLVPFEFMNRVKDFIDDSSSDIYFNFFMSGDFDAFQNGMHLLSIVPYSKPFMMGSTFFSVLYNPIPRVIWQQKPSPSIIQYLIDEELGPAAVGHTNFAVSLIAELYANFWWFGVIFGMIFLGYISAHLWNWFLTNRHRIEAWFHISLFCAYLIVVTRGSFHSMTVYYLMIVISEIITRKVALIGVHMPRQMNIKQNESEAPNTTI
jgi:oligosaccharide repeat unit polymerase